MDDYLTTSIILFLLIGIILIVALFHLLEDRRRWFRDYWLTSKLKRNRKYINLYVILLQIYIFILFLYIYLLKGYLSGIDTVLMLSIIFIIFIGLCLFVTIDDRIESLCFFLIIILNILFIYVFIDKNIFGIKHSELYKASILIPLFIITAFFWRHFDRIISFKIPDINLRYIIKRDKFNQFHAGLKKVSYNEYELKYDNEDEPKSLMTGKIIINDSRSEVKGFFKNKDKKIKINGKVIDKYFGEIRGTFTLESDKNESNITIGEFEGWMSGLNTNFNIRLMGTKLPRELIVEIEYPIETIHPTQACNRDETLYTWNTSELMKDNVNEITLNVTPLSDKLESRKQYNTKIKVDQKEINPEEMNRSNVKFLIKILSDNTFLITLRFLILILILFFSLGIISPSEIIIDPPQISDSLSAEESLTRMILITNIGSDLKNLKIYSTNYTIWNTTNEAPKNLSKYDNVTFLINIAAVGQKRGEYRGFIDIRANKSTILGESKPISIGKIPVVLNVSSSIRSNPEDPGQRETNIHISGNINIIRIESEITDC